MEHQYQQKLVEIVDRILDIKDQVSTMAIEKNYSIKDVKACHKAIASIVSDYKRILDSIPEDAHDDVERRYGRMVTDLRRHADWLPKLSGGSESVPISTDDSWAIGPRVSVNKAKKSAAPPPPLRDVLISEIRSYTETRVGGEIEAWCSPCKSMKTHTIIAMVSGEPKQVVCQSCDARHNFRATPPAAKKRTTTSNKRSNVKIKMTAAQIAAQKREQVRVELQKELASATDVRPFTQRGRYKAGEIIEHPDYGRGKIENVLRGSILVRFRTGLRPITLD